MTTLRILIPLDGSERSRHALNVVEGMFEPTRVALTLFHVGKDPRPMTEPPRSGTVHTEGEVRLLGYGMDEGDDAPHVWPSQEWASARAKLRDVVGEDARRLEREGWNVTVETAFGDPAREIVSWCEMHEPDLVAMATHGRTGLARALLGSVAERALRHLGVPLLLVRPEPIEVGDASRAGGVKEEPAAT